MHLGLALTLFRAHQKSASDCRDLQAVAMAVEGDDHGDLPVLPAAAGDGEGSLSGLAAFTSTVYTSLTRTHLLSVYTVCMESDLNSDM